jgi:hypothetical protein
MEITLSLPDVAQVAKPARLPESAASSGRFGNLRYDGKATRATFILRVKQ